MTTYTQVTAANYDRIQDKAHEAHTLETNLNRHGSIWDHDPEEMKAWRKHWAEMEKENEGHKTVSNDPALPSR